LLNGDVTCLLALVGPGACVHFAVIAVPLFGAVLLTGMEKSGLVTGRGFGVSTGYVLEEAVLASMCIPLLYPSFKAMVVQPAMSSDESSLYAAE
jgi:hypothetical protein